MKIFIDPPEGWKYGFPKELPKEITNDKLIDWLVSEGYPLEIIVAYGKNFHVGFWSED